LRERSSREARDRLGRAHVGPIRAGIMDPTGPGGRDLDPETAAAPVGIEDQAVLAIGSGEGLILAAITVPIVSDPCPLAHTMA
jgi:hypothetical protein